MGFGSEILFILMLGLLVLGPKQLHALLRHMARFKAQFEEASHGFRSKLEAEITSADHQGQTDAARGPQGRTDHIGTIES